MREGKKSPLTQAEFATLLRTEVNNISKDMRVTIQDLSMRGFAASRGYPVEFIVTGDDWDRLAAYTQTIAAKMSESGMMVDVDTSYDAGQPEIRIIPDRNAAQLRGVSVTAIGNAINALMGGARVGKFTDQGRRYDIRLRLLESERRAARDIKELYVRNNRGELVVLADVVKIVSSSSLLSITRINRERAISVYASPAPGFSQQEAITRAMSIARDVLPRGYSATLTGSAQTSRGSFDSLSFARISGIVISYMVLAASSTAICIPSSSCWPCPSAFPAPSSPCS